MNPSVANINKSSQGLGQRVWGVYLIYVLICVVFLAPCISFAAKNGLALIDPLYFIAALAVGGGLAFAVALRRGGRWVAKLEKRRSFRVLVIVLATLVALMQLYIVETTWFRTGWDVGFIASQDPFNEVSLPTFELYYSSYPNQLFPAAVFWLIKQIAGLFGIEDAYPILAVVGAWSTTVSVALCAFVARRLGSVWTALGVLVLGFSFVAFSPWILVPYTDTYSTLWIALALWFYVCERSLSLKWGGFAASSVIGAAFKPTVLALAAGILGYAFLKQVAELISQKRTGISGEESRKSAHYHRPFKRENVHIVVFLLAGALLGQSLVVGIRAAFPMPTNPEGAYSSAHFLMMGSNEGSYGCYSGDDVIYTGSFATSKERAAANLARWKERMGAMGPIGYAKLLARKTCSNFADGTMSWGTEGGFWATDPATEGFFAELYGIAERPMLFAPIAQTVWFTILVGNLLACLLVKTKNTAVNGICLALVLLSLFLMIFECRARYLFLFLPEFIILASLGWEQASMVPALKALRNGSDEPHNVATTVPSSSTSTPRVAASSGRGRPRHSKPNNRYSRDKRTAPIRKGHPRL